MNHSNALYSNPRQGTQYICQATASRPALQPSAIVRTVYGAARRKRSANRKAATRSTTNATPPGMPVSAARNRYSLCTVYSHWRGRSSGRYALYTYP
jgi:hypothetical protein